MWEEMMNERRRARYHRKRESLSLGEMLTAVGEFAFVALIIFAVYAVYRWVGPSLVEVEHAETKSSPLAAFGEVQTKVTRWGQTLHFGRLANGETVAVPSNYELLTYGETPSVDVLLQRRIKNVYDDNGKQHALYRFVAGTDGDYGVRRVFSDTEVISSTALYIDADKSGEFILYGGTLYVVYHDGSEPTILEDGNHAVLVLDPLEANPDAQLALDAVAK